MIFWDVKQFFMRNRGFEAFGLQHCRFKISVDGKDFMHLKRLAYSTALQERDG